MFSRLLAEIVNRSLVEFGLPLTTTGYHMLNNRALSYYFIKVYFHVRLMLIY